MNEIKQSDKIFYEHHNNTSWGVYARGFLCLAKNNLEKIKKEKILPKRIFKNHKKIYFLEETGLWLAIIWSIKHSIELSIKHLGINVDEKYWKSHDIDFLIKDLKNKLGKYCIEEDLKLFISIVDKYYKNNFFRRKIVFKNHIDTENTFFRYPSTNKNVDYSVLNEVTMEDVDNFLKDIYELESLFSKLESQPQHFKFAEKFGIPKEKIKNQLIKNYNKSRL